MPRLKQLGVEEAELATRKLLGKVKDNLGVVPNMFKCMANSDTALNGFLSFNAAIMAGALGGKLVKMVILATSELNGCEYCVSAHTKMALDDNLLTEEECLNARRLVGSDEKSEAMLEFVEKVYQTKGKVKDEDIQALESKGFNHAQMVEILGTMALATFANYISNVGQPVLDFPEAPAI
jgi:uncharacterized peroxidase-related enzyme